MEQLTYEIRGGKAFYDGRALADWAPVLAERIYERCHAERVVLFGSVARGDDGPDSDIDLLVVLPRVKRHHDAAVAVLRELRDLPAPVDVVVIDSEGFQRERHVPGVIRVATREGQALVADAA